MIISGHLWTPLIGGSALSTADYRLAGGSSAARRHRACWRRGRRMVWWHARRESEVPPMVYGWWST